jgi:tRNA (guanine-N7-)-methyltransferase
MRMRKNKHAAEGRLACSELILPLSPHEVDYREAATNPSYYNIREIFGNDNPLHLEIGCGKGQFVCEMAKRNPDINYVAIEVCDDVAVLACEGIKNAGLKNVRFMVTGAEYLLKYFPENSVERIYLNFSCTFPKARYAKHRLTSPIFLPMYKYILKNGCEIHQKTDNMHFFEYSIEKYSELGFKMQNVSLDLHNSGFEGNIITEYEKRFTDLGQPIYRLEAVCNK